MEGLDLTFDPGRGMWASLVLFFFFFFIIQFDIVMPLTKREKHAGGTHTQA